MKRYMFAGGGTAGHISPAMAIAKTVKSKEPDAEVLFVGTRKGMEVDFVPQAGFKLALTDVKGLGRDSLWRAPYVLATLALSCYQSYRIIADFKPDVVMGTGAYVSLPVVAMAHFMGVPTFIYEPDALPGIANRLLGRIADRVGITYESCRLYFPADKTVLTGNPVRPEFFSITKDKARKKLGIGEGEKLVLVFGGSHGAEKINEAIIDALPSLKDRRELRILHSVGRKNYGNISKGSSSNMEEEKDGYLAKPYLHNMAEAMLGADLAICRAGATTLAEITACGLPAILIPWSQASGNHQEYNAKSLEKDGAAKVILNRDLNGRILSKTILDLIDDENRLREMSERSRALGRPEATDKIMEVVKGLIQGKRTITS